MAKPDPASDVHAQLRLARPDGAEAITDLARRSKRVWGLLRGIHVGRGSGDGAGWGYSVMSFESDPHAEGFYVRLGAERVGSSPSELRPGRSLPLMRFML